MRPRYLLSIAHGGAHTPADSDHRAQAFRFDAAQRSDLIARS
jgi:hypothetical protein